MRHTAEDGEKIVRGACTLRESAARARRVGKAPRGGSRRQAARAAANVLEQHYGTSDFETERSAVDIASKNKSLFERAAKATLQSRSAHSLT